MLQSLSFEQVRARVLDTTGQEIERARVRVGFGRGHLLHLVVYLEEAWGLGDDRAQDLAELCVELLIGEQRYADWVGSISVLALPNRRSLGVVGSQPSHESYPLSELSLLVERAIAGVLHGLPSEPYWQRPLGSDWALLEAEPGQSGEGAQSDLIMASTALPELIKCALEGEPFSSCRFSRLGECFVYLVYVPEESSADERVRFRQGVEDIVDERLRQTKAGCVFGSGLGLRHCYIDVVLSEPEQGLAALARAAQEAGVPEQAWLRFFDSDREQEWVGVWETTPPPPAASVSGAPASDEGV